MTAIECLNACRDRGLTVEAVAGKLSVRPKSLIDEALRDRIREHRDEILDVVSDEWTGDALALIDWFVTDGCRTPVAPFRLRDVEVLDRVGLIRGLHLDLADGPRGPRAAELLADLAALRALIEGGG